MSEPTKCIDCGEPDPGSPDGRCRDCDIEWCHSTMRCRECLNFIGVPQICGPTESQHKPDCQLRQVDDCYAMDEAEAAALRRRMFGEP